MRDPVTDFSYPDAWVAACSTSGLLPDVERGFAVLTATGTVLRRGFSTGTTAAAACKAAVLSLKGPEPPSRVRITLPCGIAADIPVEIPAGSLPGTARCRKDAGDYPGDVTAGIVFAAEVTGSREGVELVPGDGIGRFVRDTPRYPEGSPAISPAPLACILRSIEEACEETGMTGVQVKLSIPDGKEVALRTLNPKVGIEGGISILGTTGFVEPWDDHLGESATERIAATVHPVLTTGRIGLRFARMMFPDHEVVLVGSRLRESIAAVNGSGTLIGLPGLILRFIRPEILDGTGYQTVEEFSLDRKFSGRMKEALQMFREQYPRIQVVLIDRSGSVIGESP